MPDVKPETDGAVARPLRSWSIRGRAVLILVLIPLLAASWRLHKAMPSAHLWAKFDGRRPLVYWNPSDVQHRYTGNPHRFNDESIRLMNVDTGEITASTKADLVWHDGLNARGERVMIGNLQSMTESIENVSKGIPNPPPNLRCAYFKNMETGETRHVEFDWPFPQRTIINGQFVVGRDSTRIYAIDLEDAQPQLFSVASPSALASPDFSLDSIYGTEFLYEIRSAPQSNSTRYRLELYKLGDHQIQLVKTLEMGCSYGISRLDGQLLSLTADGNSIEFRSLDNLEFIKSIDIAEEFLATHEVVELQGNLILGSNHQTFNYDYYDVLSGEQLKLPFSGMVTRGRLGRYWYFGGGLGWRERYAYVYDLQERRMCLTVPYACSDAAFIDDGRFAVSHPAFGVCTVIYDLKTGKSTRHAPYQWYAVALAGTLLAWFGWWIAWLVISAREGSWAWCDLVMIYGIVPAILLYLRVAKWYPRIGAWSDSTSTAIIIGAFIGLLCASTVFFVLGKTRRSMSLVPLTLVFAAFAFWVSSKATQTRGFNELRLLVYLISTMGVLLLALACLSMRLIGRRLNYRSIPDSKYPDKSAQLSLLDLFMLIACAGVVIAASKPLVIPFPKFSFQFLLNAYWLPTTLGACAISAAAIFAGLSERKWLFQFGCIFATVVWFGLTAQEVLTFGGVPQVLPIAPTALQTILTASTSAFICALALRLRDYRIGRH